MENGCQNAPKMKFRRSEKTARLLLCTFPTKTGKQPNVRERWRKVPLRVNIVSGNCKSDTSNNNHENNFVEPAGQGL